MEPNIVSLVKIVERFLRQYLPSDACVCVALSGGMDSIVLLDAVNELKLSLPIELKALHVQHGLSPNADSWAAFCAEVCEVRGISLTTTNVRVDTFSGAGIEGAARKARYAAFAAEGSPYMLLAQHADDQAETVLHQLLRGTGLKGLAGMGEVRLVSTEQLLLRPLLQVSRADIEVTAHARGLKWIEDESNTDTAYTRNFLRREIAPRLEERFPHYRTSLARAARHASEADVMLESLAKIDLQWDGTSAFADALDALTPMRQINALYHWLIWQKVPPPSHAQIAEWAAQLFRMAPSSKPQLAGGHDFVIRRANNRLVLQSKTDKKP